MLSRPVISERVANGIDLYRRNLYAKDLLYPAMVEDNPGFSEEECKKVLDDELDHSYRLDRYLRRGYGL